MGCLGVHFAVTPETVKKLKKLKGDDDALVHFVQEELEAEWEDTYETDKAWDALHRCLSDGSLDAKRGKPPLNKVFFGGKMLNEGDEYFVVLIEPTEIEEVAAALAKIDEKWLHDRYFALPFPEYQGEKDEDDFDFSWSNFEGLAGFFARAAKNGKGVIFTVDQ